MADPVPDGVHQPQEGYANLSFGTIFAKNYMKRLLLRSANVKVTNQKVTTDVIYFVLFLSRRLLEIVFMDRQQLILFPFTQAFRITFGRKRCFACHN